ncbi:peptidoglycan DD-metalloendopeptidase family protein [Acinetobacter sp. B10A]|uniref:peptidoglycan DD-metalloendopeptidase family protein n=1 Tax=Acinetobacter baretiae TaxID=2605383 RepID=UPI001B3C8E50|nr:peptidoglycan DD-metalloendopeptidase family protein [Acinetobacter baretiae]MBF7684657.1 peptidoglycan DD-metalloendopeptidase family protein [Acinetobacter baretiae]
MSILIKKQTKPYTRLLSRVVLLGLPIASLLLTGCASKPEINHPTRITQAAPTSYVVKPGDTLSGIANRYGLNYIAVAQMNNIPAPYTIYVHQSLKLTGLAETANTTSTPNVPQNMAPVRTQSIPPIQTQSIPLPPAQPVKVTPPPVQKAVPSVATPSASNALRWVKPSSNEIIARYDLNRNIKGIRYAGQVGDPVVAAADGQVVYADDGLKEFGNLILIKHSNGYISAYAHNSMMLVQSGARVKAGQKIAQMGSSGTNRVMLEFQVRADGKAIDPALVIPVN